MMEYGAAVVIGALGGVVATLLVVLALWVVLAYRAGKNDNFF